MSKKKPLRQRVYDEIVDDIVNGQINAGEKLVEADLAKRFRVSRTPIREAICQLEKEGYAVYKKDIGAVVRRVSLKDIRETYEIIALLEGRAMEVVVEAKREEVFSRIYLLVEEMEKQIEEKKYTEFIRSNIQFHQFIDEQSVNEAMLQIVTNLWHRVYGFIFVGLTVPKYIDRYLLSHRKLCDAIRRGDPREAGAVMRAHVEENADFILEEMSNRYRIDKKIRKQPKIGP